MTSLTIVYEIIIIANPTPTAMILFFNAVFASSLPAGFVISLYQSRTTTTKQMTIIANHKY